MASTAVDAEQVEKTAEAVVGAMFANVEADPEGGSVPDLVQRNRQNRARRRLVDALVSRGSSDIPDELERTARDLVRRWAKRGFDDGFAAVEAFEIEAAEEREQIEAERSGDRRRILEVAEQRHRRHVEKLYGKIELRGLQVSERVFQSLDMAYVPLHVTDPDPKMMSELAAGLEKAGLKPEGFEESGIEKLLQPRAEVFDVLNRYEAAVIIGGPGSGKTTLISYLATLAARGELKLDGNDDAPVPFVVTVRSLLDLELGVPEIARLQPCGEDLVESVLAEGRALVLVDGVDETPQGRLLELQQSLDELRRRFPKNRFMVTSRPSDRLKLSSGWAETSLQSLTSEEVDTFVDRWCLAAEISLQKDRASAETDARRAAEDLKARMAKSKAIRQLAETPLLATILCVVHRFLGFRIPERRVALYEACTNVLLYEWDAAKFPDGRPIGRLDAQQKRALLASVAYRMHEAEISQIPADEIIEILDGDLPKLGEVDMTGQELLEDIRDRSGLLVEREAGLYGFSHLTFQEYLAASKIVRDDLWEDLLKRADCAWWHEVLVLSGGFPNSRSDLLVGRLLEKEKKLPGLGVILAGRVAETAVELPRAVREDLQRRLRGIVPPKGMAQTEALVAIGEACVPLLLGFVSSNPEKRPVEWAWTLTTLILMEEPSSLPSVEACLEALARFQKEPLDNSPRPIDASAEAAMYLSVALVRKAGSWRPARGFLVGRQHEPESRFSRLLAVFLPFMDDAKHPVFVGFLKAVALGAAESAD